MRAMIFLFVITKLNLTTPKTSWTLIFPTRILKDPSISKINLMVVRYRIPIIMDLTRILIRKLSKLTVSNASKIWLSLLILKNKLILIIKWRKWTWASKFTSINIKKKKWDKLKVIGVCRQCLRLERKPLSVWLRGVSLTMVQWEHHFWIRLLRYQGDLTLSQFKFKVWIQMRMMEIAKELRLSRHLDPDAKLMISKTWAWQP